MRSQLLRIWVLFDFTKVGTDIEELYRSKLRLKDFIKSLGTLKTSPIQKVVLEYYGKVNEKVLTPENILRMAEKRVEK